jgi:hypothetical protein
MLVIPETIGHGGQYQSNLTAAARNGATVTCGTANTKGSYASLVDPTSNPSYGVWVRVRGISVSATVTSFLLDIAYGPTGGGNEQVIIPNLDCWGANLNLQGKLFFFPVYIPSGVRVSARAQSATASKTGVVAIWLAQDPPYGFVGGRVEAYGAVLTTSLGTSVTPASGAFGSWTQLVASTLRAHRFWTAGYDALSDTTTTSQQLLLELGVGPDASNVSPIYSGSCSTDSNENVESLFPLISYAPVPSGKAIFARIASGETEARGVVAYGVD